ncbi:MAG: family 43 glycosylhydrolase [Solirubrobacteraceae bacterium]
MNWHRARVLVLVIAISALFLGMASRAAVLKPAASPNRVQGSKTAYRSSPPPDASIAYRSSSLQGSRVTHGNPLKDSTGAPISCPDPNVTLQHRGAWRYYLVCTSDNAGDAFPIWVSNDLAHWTRQGFVFPHGHQPWWAVPSTGGGRRGIYWAPELYYFGGRWVVYFAAQYNPASRALRFSPNGDLPPGTMVIGAATADSLTGPWHTRILHYPGQFNSVNSEQEVHGGVIDPSVTRDRATGQLYLFWAKQQNEIWAGALSADGLTLDTHVHRILKVSEPWECDPANSECTIEGPEAHYHNGYFYVFYSAASTWDSTYALGIAASTQADDPSHPFVKHPRPILVAGNGFLGPASSSHPVVGKDGNTYLLYHALTRPSMSHNSADRLLMLGRLNWGGFWPLVNDGHSS